MNDSFIIPILAELDDAEQVQFSYFYHLYSKRLAIGYVWLATLGLFGMHKFYLNKLSGWLYLLLCPTLLPLVFLVFDVFMLPAMVKRYNQQLAEELYQLIKSNNIESHNPSNNLLRIRSCLNAKHLSISHWLLAGLIIIGIFLPASSYVYLRLNAQHVEIHLLSDHLDGSRSDDYLRW